MRFHPGRTLPLLLLAFALPLSNPARAAEQLSIVWEHPGAKGTLAVENGTLAGQPAFDLGPAGSRLEFELADARTDPGTSPTLIHVIGVDQPFSFIARDVDPATPIVIPAYGVAVTRPADKRDYPHLLAESVGGERRTMLQRAEAEPEENYADAAANTRDLYIPTWLGMSRDMRIFQISLGEQGKRDGILIPKMGGMFFEIPEMTPQVQYSFCLGRGLGAKDNVTRRLEDGTLPILTGTLDDEDVKYNFTMFTALEKHTLTTETLKGTPALVGGGHTYGHMFTEEQEARFKQQDAIELARDEEAVLYFRTEAVNTASVPRYAWFKTPEPMDESGNPAGVPFIHEASTGLTSYSADRVFCVTRLNGKPCPQHEMAVLIPAHGRVTFDIFLPHRPIPRERALALATQNFEAQHTAASAFWKSRLAAAAQIRVPEPRIQEMIQAGLLHLDEVSYGSEPDGTLAPTIGVYSPIGSESSPIIQFYDAMGLHKQAERAIQYFFDQQHADGFIQNFGGYMLETGPALWTAGEHFRMTHDEVWARRVKDNVTRACDYMIAWRNANKTEEHRGKGYGMIEGRVGDPPDPYRSFMLNGYAYLGLARAAEMYASIDPDLAKRLRAEAEAWKADIRTAIQECLARSPVVPLGDGSWCPTLPSWAEATGPGSLLLDGRGVYSHATFMVRDGLVGPLYLVFQEVLPLGNQTTRFLLDYTTDLYTQRNVGFSQPYYYRHDWVELAMGMRKAFLKTYYNGLASLADRETYTFHEHYFYVQPHKVHEEAWFLMQTRWMLWMEHYEGGMLTLLPGIPRAWLENGKAITLDHVATGYGPLQLHVVSHLDQGYVEGSMHLENTAEGPFDVPQAISIRLPHPDGKKAKAIIDASTGNPFKGDDADYDPKDETITFTDKTSPHFKLIFD